MRAPPLPRKSTKRKFKQAFKWIAKTLTLQRIKSRWNFHKIHKYNRQNKISFFHDRKRIPNKSKRWRWFNSSKKRKPLVIVSMIGSQETVETTMDSKVQFLEKTILPKFYMSNRMFKLKSLQVDDQTQTVLKKPICDHTQIIENEETLASTTLEGISDMRLNYHGPDVLKTICIPVPWSPNSNTSSSSSGSVHQSILFDNKHSIRLSKTCPIQRPKNVACNRKNVRARYFNTKKSCSDFFTNLDNEIYKTSRNNTQGA